MNARLLRNVCVLISDLDVHLSTWCHLVRPDVAQCNVRQAADVNSQSLQPTQQLQEISILFIFYLMIHS